MAEKSEKVLSLRTLKRAYIKAQRKVWKYQIKLAKTSYNSHSDPYGIYRSYQSNLQWWKRRATDTLYELERRGAWMATNRDHNQVNMH